MYDITEKVVIFFVSYNALFDHLKNRRDIMKTSWDKVIFSNMRVMIGVSQELYNLVDFEVKSLKNISASEFLGIDLNQELSFNNKNHITRDELWEFLIIRFNDFGRALDSLRLEYGEQFDENLIEFNKYAHRAHTLEEWHSLIDISMLLIQLDDEEGDDLD